MILSSSLVLVGPGRAGRAFARSWIGAGGRLERIVGRDLASAEKAALRIGQGEASTVETVSGPCDLLLLCVPDDVIGPVARELSVRMTPRAAFHVSGALPAEILAPLRASGAAVGSIHPLLPFTGSPEETWAGAFVAIEGDAPALEIADQIVRSIGARGHRLRAGEKPLYHAAATLAAGGTAAVLSLAVRAWRGAGLPEEEGRRSLAHLAARAATAIGERPFEEAFTGPLARRDTGTVEAHVRSLRELPEVLSVYTALAEETLRRTPSRGREQEVRAALQRGRS